MSRKIFDPQSGSSLLQHLQNDLRMPAILKERVDRLHPEYLPPFSQADKPEYTIVIRTRRGAEKIIIFFHEL